MKKQQHGQYFTIYNPFNNKPFLHWLKRALIFSKNKIILEPFAGANNLIKTLKKNTRFNFNYKSYDIYPQDGGVEYRDTLKNFPKGFDIVITNPPYLAKNSAKRKGLKADFKHDDLYKDCLEIMLKNIGYVAAIIPATFLHWRGMKERLYSYVMLTEKMFDDTETPVCLALFVPHKTKNTLFYLNDTKVNVKKDLLNYQLKKQTIVFNDPETANLGLYAFDNTKKDTIRFMSIDDIDLSKIKKSSRNIVCISIKGVVVNYDLITKLNGKITEYRKNTEDIFLTPFKGVRKDMKFRRRIMFKQARAIIEEVLDANK